MLFGWNHCALGAWRKGRKKVKSDLNGAVIRVEMKNTSVYDTL